MSRSQNLNYLESCLFQRDIKNKHLHLHSHSVCNYVIYVQMREKDVEEMVKYLVRGRNYFSRGRWTQSASWTIPDGICETSVGYTFRNTEKGDLERSSPREIPKLKSPNGSYAKTYARQQKKYGALKKVMVSPRGKIYRASDQEISEFLKDVPDEEGLVDFKSKDYLVAVKCMFARRR